LKKGGFEGNEMIRRATLKDVKEIQRLIKLYSGRGDILPRSLSELYDHLRDFFVFIRNRKLAGICALHICWEDLAEIRSLAVQEDARLRGIGVKLVKACLDEAKTLGAKRVFALSYQPEFFEKLGFKRVDKAVLPHKIWSDCLQCVRFPDCDEIALVKELDKAKDDGR
jgi:amino-acid N-acetyltransferase